MTNNANDDKNYQEYNDIIVCCNFFCFGQMKTGYWWDGKESREITVFDDEDCDWEENNIVEENNDDDDDEEGD